MIPPRPIIFSSSKQENSRTMSKITSRQKEVKKDSEQSLGDLADEILGGSDSDSDTELKLAYLSGNCCENASKNACACFLCRQCMTVDLDRLRWALRKKDNQIKKLEEKIKKSKSK